MRNGILNELKSGETNYILKIDLINKKRIQLIKLDIIKKD